MCVGNKSVGSQYMTDIMYIGNKSVGSQYVCLKIHKGLWMLRKETVIPQIGRTRNRPARRIRKVRHFALR